LGKAEALHAQGYSYREIAEATGGGAANTIRTMASCAKWKRAEGPPPAPLASFDQTAITVRAADGAKRLSNEKFRDRVALIADHLLDILEEMKVGPQKGMLDAVDILERIQRVGERAGGMAAPKGPSEGSGRHSIGSLNLAILLGHVPQGEPES
jgi:hypothetical protein